MNPLCFNTFIFIPLCRNPRLKGLKPDRKFARPSSGHVGTTREGATTRKAREIWSVVTTFAPVEGCSCFQSRLDLLPQDHWEHPHGKSSL